jgi:phosphopantothenoylcysteine decarboxylase/phosphopantothenate--cysteine ligase
MNCIVTAGPTFEPLDQVRRLTNFSTGKLGGELANYLASRGHAVTLLLGRQATWRGERRAQQVLEFSTAQDLRDRLRALAGRAVDAVYHAAAVSDFRFGKTWRRLASGQLEELKVGKISSRLPALLAELLPTPKIILQLRGWFPQAWLAGWKYEVDGTPADALAAAKRQLQQARVNACVLNGPAYGPGFGLVTRGRAGRHLPTPADLFRELERRAGKSIPLTKRLAIRSKPLHPY